MNNEFSYVYPFLLENRFVLTKALLWLLLRPNNEFECLWKEGYTGIFFIGFDFQELLVFICHFLWQSFPQTTKQNRNLFRWFIADITFFCFILDLLVLRWFHLLKIYFQLYNFSLNLIRSFCVRNVYTTKCPLLFP